MPRKAPVSTYTDEFVADLAAFLANPPEPPKPAMTLRQVLLAVSPQIAALRKVGYTNQQIAGFLHAKGVPTDHPAVARLLGRAPAQPRGKRGAQSAVPTEPAAQHAAAPEAAPAALSAERLAG